MCLYPVPFTVFGPQDILVNLYSIIAHMISDLICVKFNINYNSLLAQPLMISFH